MYVSEKVVVISASADEVELLVDECRAGESSFGWGCA